MGKAITSEQDAWLRMHHTPDKIIRQLTEMRLYEWMSQAKRDSEGTGRLPAVFHKKNNAEILVTMTFEDFMNLYVEWEAGFDFKE